MAADIVLTWNRDSDAIKAASRAVLSISDGAQHENVEMDLAQLRNGSIVYSPVTSDVVFRMEVSGCRSGEDVERIGPRAADRPVADAGTRSRRRQRRRPAAPKPDTPAARHDGGCRRPRPGGTEEKVALAQAVKPFKAESLAQRLHATASTDMPDAPRHRRPRARRAT